MKLDLESSVNRIVRITLIALGIGWSVAAFAVEEYKTVRELRSDCLDFVNYIDGGEEEKNTLGFAKALNCGKCIGNLQSTMLTYEALERPDVFGIAKICMPEGWTVEQGIRIFLQWSNENPDLLHDPAQFGVLMSHLQAFPCEKQ
jgi:hypothetical protein